MVNDQLRELNMDAAGGRAQIGGGEQAIRVLGGAKTAEQLGDTQIIVPGGKFVRLREIAEVRDGIAEIRGLAVTCSSASAGPAIASVVA